jgi:hypothetical protein
MEEIDSKSEASEYSNINMLPDEEEDDYPPNVYIRGKRGARKKGFLKEDCIFIAFYKCQYDSAKDDARFWRDRDP